MAFPRFAWIVAAILADLLRLEVWGALERRTYVSRLKECLRGYGAFTGPRDYEFVPSDLLQATKGGKTCWDIDDVLPMCGDAEPLPHRDVWHVLP